MPDIFLPPLFVFVGIFVGMLSWSLFLRWLRLLLRLLGVHIHPADQAPKRRLWLIPVLGLHPVSWLLVAIPYVTYKIAVGNLAPSWLWFAGGFYGSFLMVAAIVFTVLYKKKKARAHAIVT
jgi:hypothetical protein